MKLPPMPEITTIQDFVSFYDSIELTEQETKDALLEARKKKYFKEKHREYWASQEKKGSRTARTASPISVKPVKLTETI